MASVLPDAAAVIPVRPGGDILLMLRDDRPGLSNANRWSTIGGAVEPGETLIQAAMREGEEEIGRRYPDLIPLGFVDGARFRSHLFATRVTWSLDDLIVGEGQGLDWLSRQRALTVPLARGIAPAIKRFLESQTYLKLSAGECPAERCISPTLQRELPALLGLKPGDLLAVQGATAGFVRRLWDVLDGVRVTASAAEDERPSALLWWPRGDAYPGMLANWRSRIGDGGAIWVVIAGDVAWPGLGATARAAGLIDSDAIALPDGQRAVRFIAMA